MTAKFDKILGAFREADSVPGGAVASFNGRNGVVTSANGDYTASQVTNVPAGPITSVTVQGALNELAGLSGVTSVFGRTGAVASSNGDYTASQLTNVPAGNISAITVQNALNELDSEKVAITRQILTPLASGITGGGDLSIDRSLSVDIPNASVLAGAVDNLDEILIQDVSVAGLRKITRANFLAGIAGNVYVDVTQVAHGFTDGQAVYQDSLGVWQLALADINLPKNTAQGIVINATANTFTCVREGRITVTGHGLAPSGDYFYLSQTVAGSLTATQPTTGLQTLMGKIVDANTLDVGPVISSLSTAFNPAGSYMRRSNGITHGTVATNIMTFTTAQESNGTDITYTSDPAGGDYFTINTDGIYALSALIYSDISASTGMYIGTLPILGSDIRTLNTTLGHNSVAWTGPITAGKQVRVFNDALDANTVTGVNNQVTIVRIA